MKNAHALVGLAWLLAPALASAAQTVAPEAVEGTQRVSAEQVVDLVQQFPQLVIIDSRKPEEFEKGHIEGAVSLVDTETTSESLGAHVAGVDTPVLFYCNGERCLRSSRAAAVAVTAGYRSVYWFRGGWEEWTDKDLPVSK